MRYFFGTSMNSGTADTIHEGSQLAIEQGPWRAAPRAQLHVTALFVGEREDPIILKEAGAKYAAAFAPIQLIAGRLVTMPKDDPAMLWIRFRPDRSLNALHMALATSTGTEPSPHRPYWPHITLARAHGGRPNAVDGPIVIEELLLTTLSLFRSIPTPQGTRHEAVCEWPLTGIAPTLRKEGP
ncbi:MAG: 2'-5' RNA ligase family protein [Flavobacteriales bacterium]|nr:2'-5' RNA ligase family protein [Flavobacteriales bacterium]MBK8708856.1 2'-5' RNA ligase family protein [Flavobacteriales bacterium]